MRLIRTSVAIAITLAGVAAIGFIVLMLDDGGPIESRKLGLTDFEALSVSHGIQADVTLGDAYVISLSGRVRDLDDAQVKLKDGVLNAYRPTNLFSIARNFVDGILGRKEPVRVSISMPKLTAVAASLGGIVTLPHITTDTLKVTGETGARFVMSGAVDALRLSVASGAIVEATDLATQTAEIDAASGAKVSIKVSEVVRVQSVTGADVLVLGNPLQQEEMAAAGGTIRVQN